MTKRFSVTGFVDGVGKVQHVVTADTVEAAWQRFMRAHSLHSCVRIKIVESWNDA